MGPIMLNLIPLSWSQTQTEASASASVYHLPSSAFGQTIIRWVIGCGVPQGSILGPIIFPLRMLLFGCIMQTCHCILFHYADIDLVWKAGCPQFSNKKYICILGQQNLRLHEAFSFPLSYIWKTILASLSSPLLCHLTNSVQSLSCVP